MKTAKTPWSWSQYIHRVAWTWAVTALLLNSLMFAVRVHHASPTMGDVESAAYNMFCSAFMAFTVQQWIDFFKKRTGR